MVIDDTQDVEDIEAEQHNEDLYPPPPEDPEVTKQMERRKKPITKQVIKNFMGFRGKLVSKVTKFIIRLVLDARPYTAKLMSIRLTFNDFQSNH